MAESKKYYWLKLKKDFFKQHEMQIIESMQNGKDYVLFYLKLLLESVSHEGTLRFSDTIPYNENMLATITNTNVDVVRSALKIFSELQLIEIWDDKTIYMSEIQKFLGSETEWAEKKRIYRASKGQLEDNEGRQEDTKGQCPIRDRDKSIDKDNNICASEPHELDRNSQLKEDFEKIYSLYPKKVGKTKAFGRYKQWVSKSGKKVNGSTVHLTNRQIWFAVKKYVDLHKEKETDMQYWKGFDTLMGDSLLDYVEREDEK